LEAATSLGTDTTAGSTHVNRSGRAAAGSPLLLRVDSMPLGAAWLLKADVMLAGSLPIARIGHTTVKPALVAGSRRTARRWRPDRRWELSSYWAELPPLGATILLVVIGVGIVCFAWNYNGTSIN
jgi:hypothetical protein